MNKDLQKFKKGIEYPEQQNGIPQAFLPQS